MIRRPVKDVSASVHQKLITISREQAEDPNIVFIRYAVERLLYRLSVSKESTKFILKGAMLFSVWTQAPHRSTRDLDLLGYGEPSSGRIEAFMRSLCSMAVEDDGLTFDDESIRIEEIRESNEYEGLRVRLSAYLGNVRIPVQVDIAFGDVVTPDVVSIEFPTLLDFPKPKLLAYPPESVVAEKFQAMVYLGMVNSRMKDYYDLYILSQRFDFNRIVLTEAIHAIFKRRRTELPKEVPVALSREFAKDDKKKTQWSAFLKRNNIQDAPETLGDVVERLREFLLPLINDETAEH